MVKKTFLPLCICPFFLYGAEFIANVSHTDVGIKESFTLNLSLKDTSPKGSPDLSPLNTDFHIHSQAQLNNLSIVNGKTQSSITWKLTLLPKHLGESRIPPITISTHEGPLQSQEIAIKVSKDETTNSPEITLKATATPLNPYKNEPVIFTVQLSSQKELANVQIQKFSLENALVEPIGEPKVSAGLIEFHYLITPLKSGELKIPSLVVQGYTPIKQKKRGFFDDDMDLFSLMQGYSQTEPFAYATDEIVLSTLPPVSTINPWLAARSISIEELKEEKEALQVGEPITRILKISGIGVRASQLPSLKDLQLNQGFKVYADKPELKEEIRGSTLFSERIEHLTLIPEKPGEQVLQAITIPYWNTEKKEPAAARLAGKTLDILPVKEAPLATPQEIIAPSEEKESPAFLYVLIAALFAILALIMGWALTLNRKVKYLEKALEDKKSYDPFEDKLEVKKKFNPLNPT